MPSHRFGLNGRAAMRCYLFPLFSNGFPCLSADPRSKNAACSTNQRATTRVMALWFVIDIWKLGATASTIRVCDGAPRPIITVITPIVLSVGLLALIVSAFVWIGYDTSRAVAGRWPADINATRDFVFIACRCRIRRTLRGRIRQRCGASRKDTSGCSRSQMQSRLGCPRCWN